MLSTTPRTTAFLFSQSAWARSSTPDLLTRLAVQTGGDYLPAPSDAAIAAAYVTISELLNNEYLLTIQSSISDCGQHTLRVTVTGQANAASYTFVRCGAAPAPTPAPSSGGGGAVGVVEVLAGLVALVARRRRRA